MHWWPACTWRGLSHGQHSACPTSMMVHSCMGLVPYLHQAKHRKQIADQTGTHFKCSAFVQLAQSGMSSFAKDMS